MNAVEFIRKFGWGLAFDISQCKEGDWMQCQMLDENVIISGSTLIEIKSMIKAYEITQKLNGVDNCRYLIKNHQNWFDVDGLITIKQAIALVEQI